MGKRYLLDSNTVIDYIAGSHPLKARRRLNLLIDEEINVSVIAKIEVLSYNPDKDDNYPVLVDFFDAANVIGLTHEIAGNTIQIRQKQKIKLPAAIIAATAIQNKMTLISRNIKDFKNIQGLEVIDPFGL